MGVFAAKRASERVMAVIGEGPWKFENMRERIAKTAVWGRYVLQPHCNVSKT